MERKRLLLIYFLHINILCVAQINTNSSQVWGGYMSSIRIDKKLAIWNDAHFVPQSFWINRHGISYMFTEKIVCTFGYAWLTTATSTTKNLVRAEHRPWGQINFLFPINETYHLNHRIRFDYRIRENLEEGLPINGSYSGYRRIRFMTSLRRPIVGTKLTNKMPFISLNNEILVNFGQNIQWNYFDQNRFWVNLGYPYKNFTFQVGYMNRFVQLGSVGNMATYHTALFWLTHSIDARSSKGKEKLEETQLLHREP